MVRTAFRIVAAAAVALLLWPAHAQAGGAQAASLREVTLAVSLGPVSLPIYVAAAKGFFALEGLKVTLHDCHSGRACAALLVDRRVDVATAAELVCALASLRRADLSIIATLSKSHQIRLVARRSAGIDAPADLKGKRIGTVAGTSADYYLDAWLLFHGLDRAQVTVVALPADELGAALQRRDIDAAAVWEPVASAMALGLAGDVAALPRPNVYTQHFALMTDPRTIASRRDDLVRLLRALGRASRLIADDPDAARHILRSRLALDDAPAAAALKETDFELGLDQSLVSTMESQLRWARQRGLDGAAAQPASLLRSIDPSLLQLALPGAVSLVQ